MKCFIQVQHAKRLKIEADDPAMLYMLLCGQFQLDAAGE